jgi:hypothetical protein
VHTASRLLRRRTSRVMNDKLEGSRRAGLAHQ